MTDLFITDRLKPILEKARKFVDDELIAIEYDLLSAKPREAERIMNEKREVAKKMGLFTPHMPVEDGGMGLSLVEFGLLAAELGRSPFAHYATYSQAPDAGNMELLHMAGRPDQKEQYLKPLVAGKIRSCFSMTEPAHAGSNPVIMSTTAERNGDQFVINGRKWFTSSADGAQFAIVMAVTSPDAAPHRRASMIIVPSDTKGFNFVRNIPVMGDEGWGPFSHAEIEYKDYLLH